VLAGAEPGSFELHPIGGSGRRRAGRASRLVTPGRGRPYASRHPIMATKQKPGSGGPPWRDGRNSGVHGRQPTAGPDVREVHLPIVRYRHALCSMKSLLKVAIGRVAARLRSIRLDRPVTSSSAACALPAMAACLRTSRADAMSPCFKRLSPSLTHPESSAGATAWAPSAGSSSSCSAIEILSGLQRAEPIWPAPSRPCSAPRSIQGE